MMMISRREVKDELARRSYIRYIERVFPDVYGVPYRRNWHHERIAEVVQWWASAESGPARVMLFVPPQHGKTEIASRMLPGWIYGHDRSAKIIGGSYSATLAGKLSQHAKRVIDTDTYARLFPRVRIAGTESRYKNNTQSDWELASCTGSYIARGAGQGTDGEPATHMILDDLLSQQMAGSQAARNAVYEWYSASLRARLSKNGKVMIIMTRWHQDDIAGRLLEEARTVDGADHWRVIRFPALCEDDANPDDPRSVGEALWPEHKDRKDLEAIRSTSPRVFESLYQQNPTPPGGVIIKEDSIRRWSSLPGGDGRWLQSWDLRAGGKSPSSSYAVGQLWFVPARQPGNAYLVDQVRGRWSFPETVEMMREKSEDLLWQKAIEKLVENKADGRALIPTLQDQIAGIIPVNTLSGDKVARLEAVAPFFRAGNVSVPNDDRAPWVREWVHELTSFPGAKNDDQVDACSQALSELLVSGRPEKSIYDGWCL